MTRRRLCRSSKTVCRPRPLNPPGGRPAYRSTSERSVSLGPLTRIAQEDSVPTYAYACRDCDHRFEVVQSFSDDSLSTCPECEGSLRKVFNSVGVVFKGSGFYRTDSRSTS